MPRREDVITYLPCAQLPPGCLMWRREARGPMGVLQGLVSKGEGRDFRWGPLPRGIFSPCSIEIANSGGVIAGFGYSVDRRRTLESLGTFVHPSYRRHGLALIAWRAALTFERVRAVDLHVITDRGRTLGEALQRAHPRVKWRVSEGGKRKLRMLA